MTYRRLAMICPTLVDQGGHEFDYTAVIASSVAGLGREVVSILPVGTEKLPLPGQVKNILPRYGYPQTNFGRIKTALRRIFSYRQAFQTYGRAATVWFVHSAPQNDLALIIAAWILSRRLGQSLVLFLRHDMDTSTTKRMLVRLLSWAGRYHVHYVSDSDTLAERLSIRLNQNVALVSIPVLLPNEIARDDTAIKCGYFGAKRRPKGFLLLPVLTEILRDIVPDVRFVVQAYGHRDDKFDAAIESTLTTLELHKDIQLIDTVVDGETFGRELSACHIILLPYDAVNYSDATSGIFVMAVIARSVVVVTEQSWMARQAAKHDLSRVILLPIRATVPQIETAMQQAYECLQRPDMPSERETEWCASHTAENIWKTLMTTVNE